MAYETSSTSNVNTLLQALAVFAAAQGWTVHYNGNRTGTGAGLGTAIIVSKSGQCHTTFRTHTTNRTIDAVGHDAYNAALTTETQNNSSGATRTNEVNGPFQSYHLFAGDTYLYVVVETTAGTFKHIGCGVLQTFGAAPPAHFIYGACWDHGVSYIGEMFSSYQPHAHPFISDFDSNAPVRSTYLRCDFDGVSNQWLNTRSTTKLFFYPALQDSRFRNNPVVLITSAYTQRAPLVPPVWLVNRPGSTNSMVGVAPNLRMIMMDWIAPGDSLTLGSDVWKVFPYIRKNGAIGEPNSGNYALAFKT